MTTSKISIALLFHFILVSETSLLVSSQALPTNDSFPNIFIPSNPRNLTAPTPPPGFSTHLSFNSSIQLKPLEVYICTIELVSILCEMPWASTITLSMEMTGRDTSTELILSPFPPFSGNRLQVRYAVLGLYQVGVAIAQGNKFYELDAGLYVREEEVGRLEFRPKQGEGLNSRLLSFNTGYTNVTTTMVMADSGKIIDPEDGKFALTFSWDGVRVKAQDIFTTFLDSFAIAAEHNNADFDAYIPAARSASGDTVLSSWTVGEGEHAEMTWARLKRALIMLWSLVIGQKGRKARFEGLLFGLEYEGKGIGAGRMLRFDKGGEGTAGSAVEKY